MQDSCRENKIIYILRKIEIIIILNLVMSLKPSTPKKSIPYSVILPNARLDSDKITVLNSLRSNYRGVRDIARFYLRENNGESIPCIRIDMQSEDLAKTLINNANMVIDGRIYSIETSPRSLIVMKVPTNQTIHNLSSDLSHNYTSIESISRFYDHKNDPVDCIRINFKSDANVVQILKDKYIFINGTKAPIQPFRSLVYIKDAPVEQITETPKQTNPTNRRRPAVLTEERVQQLFNEHQQ